MQQLDIFSSPQEPLTPKTVPQGDSEHLTWKTVLQGERKQPYFKSLTEFIEKERASGKIIYPKNSEIFSALQYTPFHEVRVVILGQDPYHGAGQAHGLCFSVKRGVPPPPSLLNIFKELHSDLGVPKPSHGNLEKWTHQGILLLNAVLTVEEGKPGSHANMGWETFTDRVIRELNKRKTGLVFFLWGSYAQKKGEIIDSKKHYVLKAPHPSPFSADRGFFGCKHFSKANELLKAQGVGEVDWGL